MSVPQLKFALIDAVGAPAWCDPDFYPVARAGGEQASAIARYPEIRADQPTYAAIVAHEHLPSGDLTEAQKLTVYRAWKLLGALKLDNGSFDYTVQSKTSGYERVKGSVRSDGLVSISSRTPTARPNCPICLAASTLIAAPGGPIRVTDVRVGTVVWTQDARGDRVAAPVVAVGSMAVPAGHRMVHLALGDARELLASPGHRSADGRPLGTLKAGDQLDGATIVLWELVPYSGPRTYDLLPAGPTGRYWADGIPLDSTLG